MTTTPSLSRSFAQGAPTAEEVLASFYIAARGTDQYTFVLAQRERFGNKLGPNIRSFVKVRHGGVYLKVLEGPKRGAEVVFVPGWNGNKSRAHKGSFPDLTLSLDPHGSIMMDDQHHPIEHITFKHAAQIVETSLRAAAEKQSLKVSVSGNIAKLGIDLPAVLDKHIVGKKETAWTLLAQGAIDPYYTVHVNGRSDFDDFRSGETIVLPKTYGSRITLNVNVKTGLPTSWEIIDHRGQIYESYQWSEVTARTVEPIELSPDNPEYGF